MFSLFLIRQISFHDSGAVHGTIAQATPFFDTQLFFYSVSKRSNPSALHSAKKSSSQHPSEELFV
jgi:hypothetical protein